MKTPHADVTNQSALPEPARRAAGKSARSDGLPASGRADPVQLTPGFTPVAHEDPFGAHLLGEQVQMRGMDAGTSDHVHAAAAHGIAGPGAALPFLDQIQASFGPAHDVSHVQAHVGGAAAEASSAMGALAYATGHHVAFASGPDLHTTAHEAAHVVQQQSGVQLAGGVGASGDSYERHADQVADAVVRGESAASLLGPAGAISASPTCHGPVQKFSADEHRRMGNQGAGNAQVALDDDYMLPFGEVVALAGDHFSSIEQMRTFAKNKNGGPNSRLEIEWARKWKIAERPTSSEFAVSVGWNDADPMYRTARESAESRYYKLAAGNSPGYGGNASHFLNPKEGDTVRSTADKADDSELRPDDRTEGIDALLGRTEWISAMAGVGSVASYRQNHVKAILEAAKAGTDKQPIAGALATDAFACHYLTDSFAGGHVRTARLSIKDYWDAKIPMFATNLAGYMSQEIARYLRDHETDIKVNLELPVVDTRLPSVDVYPDAHRFSEATVTEGVYEKVIAAFQNQAFVSFGDVISGALHDRDNAKGVTAHVHGKKEVLRGDGHAYDVARRGEAKNNTAELATQAVALSVADIYKAKDLGARMSPPEVIAALFDEKARLFPAEEFLPTLTPEDLATTENPEVNWKASSVTDLLKDPEMNAAIGLFLREQGNEIKKLKTTFPGAEGEALESLAAKLEKAPSAILNEVVNWTPDRSSDPTARRHHAKQYVDAATNVKGGRTSLTPAQRLMLIRDLLGSSFPDTETIWSLLAEMDKRDAMHIIPAIGWKRLSQALDSAGKDFSKTFPEDTFS